MRRPRRLSRFARWAARLLQTDESVIEAWERLILTSFVVTLAIHGLRAGHLLEGLESRWLQLMAYADRPAFDAPVTVVTISEADFQDSLLFRGAQPLHPEPLARLVERALQHGAMGVVLDVQIHPGSHESPDRAAARLRLYRTLDSASAAAGPRIVLVRDAEAERVERPADEVMHAAWERLTANPRLFWSDPLIERIGGYVRALPRYVRGVDGPAGRPTVLGAAIDAFRLVPHRSAPRWAEEEERPTSPWRIRFTGLFLDDGSAIGSHRVDARSVLSMPVVPGQRSLLTDRMVLIGGTYYAGRDFHPTALGDMAGVYVWAEAIASWIRHDALREPPAPVTFLLEFLIGVMAGLFLVRFGPAWGLLCSLLIVGPLTLAFSLLTFGDRVLFVNFLPSMVGVQLYYQVELHHEIRRLRRRERSLH